MLKALTFAALASVALASCPNQCSGHGRCSEFDKCVCFKQVGLNSPYRYGFTGADCSQRTCPLGRAFDLVSTTIPSVSPSIFNPATGASSNDKLNVVYIPSSQDAAFRDLRRDQTFIIKIMTVSGSSPSIDGTFTWRLEEDEYFQPENVISDNMLSTAAFPLTKTINNAVANTGVYIYWDPTKHATSNFQDVDGEIAEGDTYTFTLKWNNADYYVAGDDNSAHQRIECSGRGTCDSETGKCTCLAGYTGEACQRTVCPNGCSGHGTCQTQHRFASDGLSANTAGYDAFDKDMQYGCKCDAGYRGADCSQIECPSGPDVMGADGGAEGMDCSGRGLCDYSTGVCKCFRGFFGERCEQQTTLI